MNSGIVIFVMDTYSKAIESLEKFDNNDYSCTFLPEERMLGLNLSRVSMDIARVWEEMKNKEW